MKRKNWFTAITVIFFLFGIATGSATALDEIRIGTIGPITGWATIFGQGNLNGINLALEEHGNAFNGIRTGIFGDRCLLFATLLRRKSLRKESEVS